MTMRTLLATLLSAGLCATATAEPVKTHESISYDGAKAIVAGCEALARTNDWAVAIWVLDVSGNPVLFASINNASAIGAKSARMKAETSLQLGQPSEQWQPYLNTPSEQLNSMLLGLFTSPGGLPIVRNGKVVGAIGAGGLPPIDGVSLDKQCAQAGIDSLTDDVDGSS